MDVKEGASRPARGPAPAGQDRRAQSQGRAARMRQWLTRAKGSAGYERHTLELIGKSALAATVAWFVAHDLMAARSPAFAPFSAVLMMQVTVYRSLLQSLRYLGAVVAGVAIQAALGFLAGPDLLTFALVALIAMVIGRWRRLGTQGGQVATAAFVLRLLHVHRCHRQRATRRTARADRRPRRCRLRDRCRGQRPDPAADALPGSRGGHPHPGPFAVRPAR
ncbi:FUSC family protein [Streptomyces albus]